MPSIINSDDGVVSGTSGLKTTGGNDGITAFQQNGTERMRIDSSGNVGIGTSSPQTKLSAVGEISAQHSANDSILKFGNNGTLSTISATYGSTGAYTPIRFLTSDIERMRIDSSGNVGIGTTSPAGRLDVRSTYVSDTTVQVRFGDNTGGFLDFGGTAGANKWINASDGSTTAYPLAFQTGGTERARIPAAGGFQCVNSISVGNATPTTSGAGITFPATQSASTDANTLDDYEEGTWTPTILGSTTAGTTTYTTQLGRYTKVGRLVTASGYVIWSNATGTGGLLIGGLPFTAQNVTYLYQGVALGWSYNVTTPANTIPMLYISPNSTNITVYGTLVAGGASVQVVVDTAGEFIYTATYLAD